MIATKMQAWVTRVPALQQALTQGKERWNQLGLRERRAVTWTATGLALLILWSILVSPALKSLQTAQTRLVKMDAEWAQMQSDAAQARALRNAPSVSPVEAETALRAASERLGNNARLTLQGDRATLQLNGIAGTALTSWLAEVRLGARARPVESSLSRANGVYSGTVVVTLPSAH